MFSRSACFIKSNLQKIDYNLSVFECKLQTQQENKIEQTQFDLKAHSSYFYPWFLAENGFRSNTTKPKQLFRRDTCAFWMNIL